MITFEFDWFSIAVLMVQLLKRTLSLHYTPDCLVVNTVSVQVIIFFFNQHKAGLSLSRPLIAVQYSRSRDIQYNLYTA